MALLTELARENMAVRRTLKKLNREAEWKTSLVDLKAENKRKRRLVEILDGLEDRPIIG